MDDRDSRHVKFRFAAKDRATIDRDVRGVSERMSVPGATCVLTHRRVA